MDQLGAGRRGVRGEVILLDQENVQAAPGGVARDTGAVDPASDDQQVECRRIGHRRLAHTGGGEPSIHLATIAARRSPAYVPGMAAALIRLVLLVALALMPMGMASAPAAAPAPTAAGHCDEHQQPADAPMMDVHCATCAALPAIAAPPGDPGLRPETPRFARAAGALSNTEPEIATPPPRLF